MLAPKNTMTIPPKVHLRVIPPGVSNLNIPMGTPKGITVAPFFFFNSACSYSSSFLRWWCLYALGTGATAVALKGEELPLLLDQELQPRPMVEALIS